ncbi:oligosaccharide flippase family protein [Allorhizocola rhizosphaerae]|uniref:oligosaccharide flippase family protein n=1 Tax=Allorhizocola rhizosphaerae TaxID=1872709 RepID=UPI000E3E6E5D|nr:oligosaccharide flippase family protein [Allorhizocola rhizosphaerae]
MTGLGRKVAVAARLSLLNTVLVRIGNFAMGVILARYLLGPHEWGLYAVGAVVLAVLLSANEMGVSLALIRWEGDVRRFAPTVLTLSTLSSLTLYGALFALAPTIASLLGSAEATNLLRVLCFAVVIDGIACVPNGKLTRDFAQGKRMAIDLATFLISTAVTLTLAALGAGAMSFAWGALAGSASALVGAAIFEPRMLRWGWDPQEARKLVRFGLPLAGASLLVLAMVNVDSMVVGAALGPVALGFYQIASNMAGWPVRTISEAARRVSFAGFSRLAEGAGSLADGYYKAFGILLTAAVPACALLGALAEPVVRVIYGDTWAPAGAALRFLAVLGLFRIVYELSYDCLIAAGRRKALLALQAWWLAALVPSLMLLAPRFGIGGVAAGQVMVALLLVAPIIVAVLARVGISPIAVLRAGWRPLAGGIVVVAVARLAYPLMPQGFIALAGASLVALLAYVPFALPMIRNARRPRPMESSEDAAAYQTTAA